MALAEDEPTIGNGRGQDAGIDTFEVENVDGVAGGLVRAGGHRKIDRGNAACRRKGQRVGAGAAVDRRFPCRDK